MNLTSYFFKKMLRLPKNKIIYNFHITYLNEGNQRLQCEQNIIYDEEKHKINFFFFLLCGHYCFDLIGDITFVPGHQLKEK